MPVESTKFDELAINTIRFLSADGVQKANSGHPGMPMACAPIVYLLYSKYMRHNPADPKWFNRDRFVLSAGHGSMLLYSVLHLAGFGVSMEDIKNFRQWESITPGHPEYGLTPGVETTTGPLGQGFANAVGMAIAQAHLAAKFNKDDIKIIDHYIYGICSDGDLMEGVSHEAASLAGHLRLKNLIFFYDANEITIDGSTSLAFTEDVGKRFEAYGWHVLRVENVNDLDEVEKALTAAQGDDRPSLIVTKTTIGFGAPNKQGTAEAHGSPLGPDELKAAKKNLGWNEEWEFHVPEEVYAFWGRVREKGDKIVKGWNDKFSEYKSKYPADAEVLEKLMRADWGDEWKSKLPIFEDDGKKLATRAASGKVINSIAESLPGLIGGSADLAPSNNTLIKGIPDFSADNYAGRNMRFGVREHGMASAMNGMCLYGGVIPYGGTFLIFSDYLRPAIRLGSLSGIRPIYIFTHDSIGLGEDGPTHQPIEHLSSLRAIPNVYVIRPADANETAFAWQAAIEHSNSPVCLILTRQGLPILDQKKYPSAKGLLKGAYVLYETAGGDPEIILMASGSEVSITLEAARKVESDGVKVRVVSFPCHELFEKQEEEYKESILPSAIKARVAVEAGVHQSWDKYLGTYGAAVSVERFGASAPDKILFKEFGFTPENIYNQAVKVLGKVKA